MDERLIAARNEYLKERDAYIAQRLEEVRLRGGRLHGVISVDRQRGKASLTTITCILPRFAAKPVIDWQTARAVEAAYGAAFCDGHPLVLTELFERACKNGIVFG